MMYSIKRHFLYIILSLPEPAEWGHFDFLPYYEGTDILHKQILLMNFYIISYWYYWWYYWVIRGKNSFTLRLVKELFCADFGYNYSCIE